MRFLDPDIQLYQLILLQVAKLRLGFTTPSFVILKFHDNITVNVNCDRDFVVKYHLPAQGFEPMTSRLMSSCYGITLVERFCISPIYHFDPFGSQWKAGGLSRGHECHFCSH